MNLLLITFEELKLLGEVEFLMLTHEGGIEHIRGIPTEYEFWDSSNEKWESIDVKWIPKTKRPIYLILEK